MYAHIAYVCVYQCINVNVCMSVCKPARMLMTSIVCVCVCVCVCMYVVCMLISSMVCVGVYMLYTCICVHASCSSQKQ